jgi:hypothetical protein
MLHDKSTKIISELKNYFSSNEKIFQTLFTELRSLISDKIILTLQQTYLKKSTYFIVLKIHDFRKY